MIFLVKKFQLLINYLNLSCQNEIFCLQLFLQTKTWVWCCQYQKIDFHYLTFVKNDCCYICRKETITFLFVCYFNSDFSCTCASIDEPICCIEMVEFGYEDICQMCEKTLCFYFSDILSLVYNDEP